MPKLPHLSPAEIEASLTAFRSLIERLTPGVMHSASLPLDQSVELKSVRAGIEATLDGADTATLQRLLETASGDPRMSVYPAELRRSEAKLYRDALIRRGEMPEPLHPVARRESADLQVQVYRFILGSFLASIPDEQLIAANRKAFARYRDLEPVAGVAADRERSALQIEMDLLGAVMDANGATQRYVAALKPAGAVH